MLISFYKSKNKAQRFSLLFAIFAMGWLLFGKIIHLITGLFNNPPEESVPKTVRVQVQKSLAQIHPFDLTLRGHTASSKKVIIRAETNGRVKDILKDKGETITQGTVILKLGLDDRLDQLSEAEALVYQRNLEYEAAKKLETQAYRSKNTVAQAKTQLESAKARLAKIKTDLEETSLVAPFSGLLNDLYVEVGDYLKVGDRAAEVISLDPIKVELYASEDQMKHLKKNLSCQVELANGQKLSGIISYISAIADPRTRTYNMEVLLNNPSSTIPDGMTAEVKLTLGQEMTHTLPPSVLTLDDIGRLGVRVVDESQRVRFYPIDIVHFKNDGVLARGLPNEVLLITLGHEFVNEGEHVIPIQSEETDQKRDP